MYHFFISTILLAAAGTLFAGTHKLTPSGGDDTSAVQAALDRCATDTDCIVEFAAGVYRTKQVYVKGFRGVIRGAGSNATIVEPFGTLDMQEILSDGQYPGPGNLFPNLWSFIDGNIRITDMGFRVLTENPVKPYQNIAGYPGPNPATHMLALVYVTGERADLDVARCSFEGAKGNFPDPTAPVDDRTNLHWGIVFWGLAPSFVDGGLHVTSTTFRSMASGLTISRARNRLSAIGGAPEDGNTFDRACWAIEIFSLDATVLEIVNNTFKGCQTPFPIVWVQNATRGGRPWTEQAGRAFGVSTVLIAKNQFHMSAGYGIFVVDIIRSSVESRLVDYVISGNHFWITGGQPISVTSGSQAIQGDMWSTSGAVVSKNIVEGTSTMRAIEAWRALNTSIIDNDLSKFTTTLSAPYHLGNSLNGIVSGEGGTVQTTGIGVDTHTLVGVRR